MGKMKTDAQFKQEVFELYEDEYSITSEYEGIKKKVKIKHKSCNKEHETLPSYILKGYKCVFCNGYNKKKTTEIYKDEIVDIVGKDYEVLGEYKNAKSKILFKHNKCGNEFLTTPDSFKSGRRCPNCSFKNGYQKRKLPHMKKFYKMLEKDGYELVGNSKYKNTHSTVNIRHVNCGHEYFVSPANFMKENGTRCPVCADKNRSERHRKTQKQFEEQIFNLVGNDYSVLGEYEGTHKPIPMRHNSELCGNYTWYAYPNAFLNNQRRCPKCVGRVHWDTKTFSDEVERITSGEYKVIGDYIDSDSHIKIRHNCDSCNRNEYTVAPFAFLRGTRCPRHNHSKGESKIENLLTRFNVEYIAEYCFSDCRTSRLLPFDFFLNNEILIEFDGLQHMKSVDHFGGEKAFQSTVSRDKIKNQYCIDSNIPLIRIPYWEFDNIEYILDNTLKYFNITDGHPSDTNIVEKYYVNENWNHNTYLNMNKKEKVTQ